MADGRKYTVADRLRQIMVDEGLKQVDILEKCKPYAKKYNEKLSKNALSQYVSGKVEPGQRKMFILAQGLGVNVAWLMGFDNVPKRKTTPAAEDKPSIIWHPGDITKGEKPVWLIGDIACGNPIVINPERTEFIDIDDTKINADFCLRARGDSMTGLRINSGDIVFIHAQNSVENGQVAAVVIRDEVTLKTVYYYPEQNKLVLQSANPKYAPFVYEGEMLDEIRIIGRAVAFQSYV